MANQLLTISEITNEALMVLENQLGFAKKISRNYDDQFAVRGAKIGSTINIRKPPRYMGRTGQGLAIEDAIETSVPLTLSTQRGVDIAFTSADLALNIDEFQKRFIRPAIIAVANGVDYDGTVLYQSVYNVVGTPGTVPNTTTTYLAAGQRLSEEAAPLDGRNLCFTPAMNASIVDAMKGLFNPQAKIGEQLNKGMIAKDTLGFEGWYMDQNLRTHTIGQLGGVPLVNGAGQTGSSLVTNGWTAAAAQRLNVGDMFTIAGVFAVNPQNRQSTNALRNFVVTAPGSSDGSGNMTISISPAITVSGPFQTVTASPASGAALTVFGTASTTTPQGLAFCEEAFALGCADLPLPDGVDKAARASDDQLGLSIRLVRAYDINTDRFPCRLDILYGYTTLYAELACRIAS